MKKLVFNLEFRPWCPEFTIAGYRFVRVNDYDEQVRKLQHLAGSYGEFNINPNSGEHAITAHVILPNTEDKAVLEWAQNSTALSDVLLLLSIFTRRDVFAVDENKSESHGVILHDPRIFKWGGVLQCSLPYKAKLVDTWSNECDVGFEESLNRIYALIRSNQWLQSHGNGYFLFLARMAFRYQPLESSFLQCWTIWEHLFSIFNNQWLSDISIRNINAREKIAFLLVKYALVANVDNNSRNRIESLAKIRNRLVHFGRFPDEEVINDAVLFIRLTEFVIAKMLGLIPSNVFNTVEGLENFLTNIKKPTGS